MSEAEGFWSYVRKDDVAERGRIVQTAHDIVARYEMLTGETIHVFLDKDDFEWGDDWERKANESLASIAFFVPVLTPRYFQSAQCRRELNYFARRTTELGVRQLLMPLYYLDVPGLEDEQPDDPLMLLVRQFHWEDWRALTFATLESQEYRAGIDRLARRLVKANATAERADITAAPAVSSELDGEEGILDLLATTEVALPAWVETVAAIGQEIERIGALMQDATGRLNNSAAPGKGFAHRLVVLRQLASELESPTQRIGGFGEQFTTQLHDVDRGVRTIIERLPEEIDQNATTVETACGFFAAIRGMAESSEAGLGALEGMVAAIAPIEQLSRDIRPPMRELRHGLTLMVEGREVIRAWVTMIDESGIDCGRGADGP